MIPNFEELSLTRIKRIFWTQKQRRKLKKKEKESFLVNKNTFGGFVSSNGKILEEIFL